MLANGKIKAVHELLHRLAGSAVKNGESGIFNPWETDDWI